MRIQYPSGVRESWFDRNAIPKWLRFEGTFAPHALALRATYTVPADKRAMLLGAQMSILRTVASGTIGLAKVEILLEHLPASDYYLNTFHYNTAVSISVQLVTSFQVALMTGDKIELYTEDPSVGGTLYYFISASLVEFDA